ncbi:MAG: cytochrome c oxidase subunit II [Actinomycetota bacterium]|nr:cytochrome c oxidase subunit II [Actinomycetota bacterium]
MALAADAAILLSACAPPAITKQGDQTHSLYNIVLVLATVVFVGVEIAIVYNALRYRRRKGDDTMPPQIHGNRNVEILWTAIPSVIVMALFVMSMKVMVDVNHQPANPALTVDITGFQWQWKFDYYHPSSTDELQRGAPYGVSIAAEGQLQPPTLVLPVGEVIHFNEISPDVIHSFYVPAWLFKRDVVPGRTNTFDVTIDANRIGTYHGQCAELCGDFHNEMTFTVQTMTSSDFQSWLTNEAAKQAKQGTCSPAGTSLEVTAKNTAFDTKCLAAPANQAFTIKFDNQDVGVPHNVAIYTKDPTQGGTLLGGATSTTDTITGPATTTYQVKALQAGTYLFRCDVHPAAMFGTFVVK